MGAGGKELRLGQNELLIVLVMQPNVQVLCVLESGQSGAQKASAA